MPTAICTAQPSLFDDADGEPRLPPGLAFAPAIIGRDEEAALLAIAAALPLRQARHREYTARRRVHAWGGRDGEDGDDRGDGDPGRPRPPPMADLPPPLQRLRERLAAWAGVDPDDFVHAMVSEYRPGTPLGWHRDAPRYELIVGVSLGSPARLRFRPWPPIDPKKDDVVALDLAPRSAYRIQGVARWGWQHSVPPVEALRHSVTLRTARTAASARR